MGHNLPVQLQIGPQRQMAPQGGSQRIKYPRKSYPERGHENQKLIQEIVETTTEDTGVGIDILEMDSLS